MIHSTFEKDQSVTKKIREKHYREKYSDNKHPGRLPLKKKEEFRQTKEYLSDEEE